MRRANILIVDHDETFSRFATNVLTRAGHRFVSVDRAASALERVRAQSFDLVLAAHDLPDGDEASGGTDPLEADTDGDGLSDGDEVGADGTHQPESFTASPVCNSISSKARSNDAGVVPSFLGSGRSKRRVVAMPANQ